MDDNSKNPSEGIVEKEVLCVEDERELCKLLNETMSKEESEQFPVWWDEDEE